MANYYKPNYQGYRELRNSRPVMQLISGYAERVRASAGSMGGLYTARIHQGSTRCRAKIYTANAKAAINNKKYNTLMKALGGAFRPN